MKRITTVLVATLAVPLIACNDPNTAVFVTNSSVGINVDTKPATVSVAYDRLEGFIGPRYPNGGAPPVVASMEIQGDTLNPTIRQTYAPGAAAVGAASGKVPTDVPTTLEGRSDQKKLMFFGTATTFGLKIGFATAGAPVPDSFLLGYRRKEASIIPIAETPKTDDPTKVTAVYPSVLGSMEVNVKSTGTSTDTTPNAGLVTKQFFATGQAAHHLSVNPAIQEAFRTRAIVATRSGLSEKEIKEAYEAGTKAAATARDRIAQLADYVTATDGTLDKAKLKTLVVTARNDSPRAIRGKFEDATSVGVFRDSIEGLDSTINALFAAMRKLKET
jgi:hypothetical protein